MSVSNGVGELLDLDGVVALAELFESVVGRALAPEESSRLKAAYHGARADCGGVSIRGLAARARSM